MVSSPSRVAGGGDFHEASCGNTGGWRGHTRSTASPTILLHCHQLERVTASIVSYRLEEIDGFFARNNDEYLALIFEKEGSYVGREVSCPRGLCTCRVALERKPGELRRRAAPRMPGSQPRALT